MSKIVRTVKGAVWAAGILWFAAAAAAQYDPPAGYYDTATGNGATLKAQLNAIIDGHTAISYSNRAAPLKVLDQDPANSNNVLEVYTGTSVAKTEFPAGSANTEHLWAQSYGIDGTEPAYGDLFNLRPCDPRRTTCGATSSMTTAAYPPSTPPCATLIWTPGRSATSKKATSPGRCSTWTLRDEGDSTDGFPRDLVLTDDTADYQQQQLHGQALHAGRLELPRPGQHRGAGPQSQNLH